MKRGGRLPPKSAKRRALDGQRMAMKNRVLFERPFCEAGVRIGRFLMGAGPQAKAASAKACRNVAGCTTVAVDLHEPLTRARAPGPEAITDEDRCVPICRHCHDWTHANVADAEAIGLLVPSHKGDDDAPQDQQPDDPGGPGPVGGRGPF